MTETSVIQVSVQVASPDGELAADDDYSRWVNLAISHSGRAVEAGACVTIRLVDEAESAELNNRYREINRPTNVLAFPAAPLPVPEADPELGDLIICASVVLREAEEQGKALTDHLAHLTMHGSLHLVGYDHIEGADALEMEALETSLLADLGIADPY